MGWPPAVVIVVRHGARLDAADKQWHLTSPTPYDPPLTWGGWTQSRALGARIGSILRSRETDDEAPVGEGEEPSEHRRKRRHKVIIHTSPFHRCVQTSAAIAAGLAQNPSRPSVSRQSRSRASTPTQSYNSPKVPPTLLIGSPRLAPLAPVHEPDDKDHGIHIKKALIRVDAFLGEWLSPDYFENITPPPSSVMMVAGAKADLLRKEDYSGLITVNQPTPSTQGFPGGWQSPVSRTNDENPFTLAGIEQALPRRDRTSSVGSTSSRHSGGKVPTSQTQGIYQPPVPNYSISPSSPIPPGYVAHARDACLDVDYQWDSMRDPQDWGTGGEYGEEWSSMHKRFRKGLQQMVQWYSFSDEPAKLATKKASSSAIEDDDDDEADEEDTDLVLVLVTHGAGCNALIGALTAQPVLLDVGMSSLTMAVRKPPVIKSTPTSTGGTNSRVSSRTLSISEEYDVKLVANTEHLRSQTSTPSTSRQPSISGLSAFRERYVAPGSSDQSGYSYGKPIRSVTTSAGLGSIRRNNSIATVSPRNYAPTRQSSIGLWSAPKSSEEEEEEEMGSSMVLNFRDSDPVVTEGPAEEDDKSSHVHFAVPEETEAEDGVAPLGLWGAPRPPGDAERMREIAPKRRWTVNERASAP